MTVVNGKLQKFRYGDPSVCPESSRGRNAGGMPDSRLLAISVTRNDKGNPSARLVNISVHKRVLEGTGWIKGDYVSFTYDEGIVVLFRSPDGRMLTGNKSESSTRHNLRFRVYAEVAALFENTEAVDVEVAPGRAAFVVKKVT